MINSALAFEFSFKKESSFLGNTTQQGAEKPSPHFAASKSIDENGASNKKAGGYVTISHMALTAAVNAPASCGKAKLLIGAPGRELYTCLRPHSSINLSNAISREVRISS